MYVIIKRKPSDIWCEFNLTTNGVSFNHDIDSIKEAEDIMEQLNNALDELKHFVEKNKTKELSRVSH
jgi:ribosome-associated translation inhibitor RaiA